MQIKRYVEAFVPVNICNMQCTYCYLNKNIPKVICELQHEPEFIAKALSRKRLGGPALINLCAAGETTLLKNMIGLTKALLEEGHILSIVTNGTNTNYFKQVVELPENLRKNIFFKFSLHYFELEKMKKTEVFFDNIDMVKKAGCSFTIELTPDDSYLKVKEEIKELCLAKAGAICHVTVPRNDTTKEHKILSKYSIDELAEKWSDFDSSLLRFKQSIWAKPRCEFCYAGDWFFTVDLSSGITTQCYEGADMHYNIYQNVNQKIPFRAVGTKCPSSHCFNGHAFLPLGVIPEFAAPTYTELRDRLCTDGSHWITEEMSDTLNSRLKNANREYSKIKKAFTR